MRLSVRLLLLLGLITVIFFSSSKGSFAQTPYQSNSSNRYLQVEKETIRIQNTMLSLSSILICQLSGIDVLHPGYNCIGQKIKSDGSTPKSMLHPEPLGLLGFVANGIDGLYQKPISTSQSINYFASNFGISKNTYAQTSDESKTVDGFKSFQFIQSMFIELRNLSFTLIIIVFILIGVGIMLRFKIDPRTAMNIQNQLPKVVVGIVLITFSYSIAGLLVDGMWFVTYFGVNTIGKISQNQCGKPEEKKSFSAAFSQSLLNNPIGLASDVFGNETGCFGTMDGLSGLSIDVGKGLGPAATKALMEVIVGDSDNTNWNCGVSIGWFGDGHISDCFKEAIYYLFSFLIGIAATLIALIAVIIALIRLWITLLKAYIYILLDVISAPLQILVGILPGGRMGFGRWIKHLIAHLLVFPAAAIMIALAVSFALNSGLNNPSESTTFFPPLLGVPGESSNLGIYVAFGLLLVTPELLQMIKDAFGVKSNSAISGAIIGGFGRGVGPSKVIGGFAKTPFGKDKNGNSRFLRAKLGNKWRAFGGSPNSWLSNRPVLGKAIGKVRNTRANWDDEIRRFDQGSRKNLYDQLSNSYESEFSHAKHMKQMNDDEAHEYALQQIRSMMQYGKLDQNRYVLFEKQKADSHGVSQKGRISMSQLGLNPPGQPAISQTPSSTMRATGNTSAAGQSSSARANSPHQTQAVASSATGTTANMNLPTVKARWVKNELKEEGTGKVLATYTQDRTTAYKTIIPTGLSAMSTNQFEAWRKTNNIEIL